MNISFVQPLFAGATWPYIREHVIATCEASGGRRTPAKVLAELMDNVTSLWVAHDDEIVTAFCTTRIVHHDAVTLLRIEMMGGEQVEAWLTPENLQVLTNFAEANGCSGIEAQGRHGWKPRFKQLGITAQSTNYEIRWD